MANILGISIDVQKVDLMSFLKTGIIEEQALTFLFLIPQELFCVNL